MTFYNTINVRGSQLSVYIDDTKNQEDIIAGIFEMNPLAALTPEDILKISPDFSRTPITSIRRAFTNLKKEGVIFKTDYQIEGMYGKPIYTWKLSKAKRYQQIDLLTGA